MKKIIYTFLLSLLTLPVFSQGFNDSIMNKVLFDEIMSYTMKRDSTVKLYYSNVGEELYSQGGIDYIKTHGLVHRPSHIYFHMIPDKDNELILEELSIENVYTTNLRQSEILARIGISGQTTYQDVAKRAINGWLNSPGHAGSIENIGTRSKFDIISISSYYDKNRKSIFITLTKFGMY